MSNANDGGAAFPHKPSKQVLTCVDHSTYPEEKRFQTVDGDHPGMSLLDYFAAKIAASLWTNNEVLKQLPRGKEAENIAALAYEQARALLAIKEAK